MDREENSEENLTTADLIEVVVRIRYSIRSFKDEFDNHFPPTDGFWQRQTSRLSTLEARMAGMEVKLSSLDASRIRKDEIGELMADLRLIDRELSALRIELRKYVEEKPLYVN